MTTMTTMTKTLRRGMRMMMRRGITRRTMTRRLLVQMMLMKMTRTMRLSCKQMKMPTKKHKRRMKKQMRTNTSKTTTTTTMKQRQETRGKPTTRETTTSARQPKLTSRPLQSPANPLPHLYCTPRRFHICTYQFEHQPAHASHHPLASAAPIHTVRHTQNDDCKPNKPKRARKSKPVCVKCVAIRTNGRGVLCAARQEVK